MRDGTQGDRPSCRPQAQDRPRLALRFRAYGERKYITLGTDAEGWDHKRAETELEGELAKVRAGVWRSPHPEPAPDPPTDPSFHEFASEWFAAKRHEIAPNTVTDYEWRLTHHLLPFFATHRLSQITVAEVDHYKTAKLREADELRRRIDAGEVVRQQNGQRRRPLSASTINKTITLLSVILDVAEERELIARNPARGKRRRVKERQPKRTQLDTATAITALLGAAGELDAEAQQHPQIEKRVFPRRAIVATLLLSGPRIGELIDTRWTDVDLANGRIQYDSKTDAGCRWVRLLPALREELTALKLRRDPESSDFVFCTARGSRQSESNIRNRVLTRAVERANERLVEARENPLPHLTPHGCRRTFASIRYALGATPPEVQAELGHTNPSLALAVYTQAIRMSADEKERLMALVEISDWAPPGTSSAETVPEPSGQRSLEA